MTQIVTVPQTSLQQGPRGIGARSIGGAYDAGAQADLVDTDAFQAGPTLLSGTTDALAPVIDPRTGAHGGGNNIVKTAGVNAMTLPTPIAGVDDNLTIAIFSDTLNAHTITAASACIVNGAAAATVITFKAFKGSGVLLRAFNGTWQVLSSNVTSIA